MTKKRERLEVIHDILEVIKNHNNSIRPTPLLRFANLSTQRFNEYLPELFEKKLVKEIEDAKGRKYLTLTDKGFRYLERYSVIVTFIDEFEL